jgi:hypothetical protein
MASRSCKETYPGADGLMRAVKVQSKSKEYIIPVHRLRSLEYIEEQSDSDDTCAC